MCVPSLLALCDSSPPDAASSCDKRAQLAVLMLSCQLPGDPAAWKKQFLQVKLREKCVLPWSGVSRCEGGQL